MDPTTIAPPPATDTPDTTTPTADAAPASSSSSPLLVTSAASRAQYANNESNLQSTLSGITTNNKNYTYVDTNGNEMKVAAPSPEAAIATAPNIAEHSGVQIDPPPDGSGGTTTPPAKTPAPANATDDADAEAQQQVEQLGKLPPEVQSQFKGQLDQQDQNIADAQSTLASVRDTLNNDPAAVQAANAISANYGVLINAMKEKNRQVLGSFTENAARNGSLQYANDMHTTFMSNEMDRASQRVADLVAKEQELILKSNTAYKNGDIKAFNAAQTALTKAQSDKTTTLGKLLTASNAQVKAVQAQVKATAATKSAKVKNDISLAKSTAAGIVDAITKSGVTDEKQIKQYISEMADHVGISDPAILESAVVTARQTADKTALSLANTRSTIAKRGSSNSPKTKTTTDGSFTYSGEDTAKLASLLNQGTTDGTYAGRGADGYVDPGAYTHAYTAWIAAGGTPKGFLKVAPVTNINPDSIPLLPAAIQPKTKAASTTQYPVK